MTTVESARKYEDLLGSPVAPSPYEYASLFKAEGFGERRNARKRFKMLKALDLKIRYILAQGEKVYHLTRGSFAGYPNKNALVFTSHRILLLHISAWGRPLHLVAQLPYATIASVQSGRSGVSSIKLLNRKVLHFAHFPAADRKLLDHFLANIVQLTNAPFEQKRGIEPLCPHCFAFVPDTPTACPGCNGRFKSARTAGLLSLLFPGVGGWYLQRRWFALVEMGVAGALWYLLVSGWLAGLSAGGPHDWKYLLSVGAALLLLHAISAATTYDSARKGLYPSGAAPLRPTLPPYVDRPKPGLNSLNKLRINRTTPPS